LDKEGGRTASETEELLPILARHRLMGLRIETHMCSCVFLDQDVLERFVVSKQKRDVE
jgi:hypothetical protein